MFTRKKWLSAALLVLVLVGAGLAWWNLSPVQTDYITVQKGDAVETLLAAGKVVGESTIPLSFSQAGTVAEVLAQEGTFVEKGQLLLSLENSRVLNLIRQRENALARGQVSLERLQTEEIARAEETVNQAELQHLYAEELYQRNNELYREGVISTAELEQTEQSLEQALSNLAQARITLQGLQSTSLRLARLDIEQTDVLLADAKLQLEGTFLRAPLAGMVIRSGVSLGEFVQPGQPLLYLVPEAEFTYVEAELDEDLSGQVTLGQEAIVTASALPGKQFKAQVSRIAPSIDASRGTFTVRLALEEQVPALLPDLAVFAEIITGRRQGVLILDQRFLSRDDGQIFVLTPENEQARRRELVTEDLGNGRVAVLEGLEEGDRVLTALELRDGQRIRLLQGGE